MLVVIVRQKAPSAIRCIKTARKKEWGEDDPRCQKAPSAIRCIKTDNFVNDSVECFCQSESTERHKVH